MSGYPFPDLLKSLAGDVRALAVLVSGSRDDDVRVLSTALRNLERRIEPAAEIALRMEEDAADGDRSPPAKAPPHRTIPLTRQQAAPTYARA